MIGCADDVLPYMHSINPVDRFFCTRFLRSYFFLWHDSFTRQQRARLHAAAQRHVQSVFGDRSRVVMRLCFLLTEHRAA